MGSTNKTAIVMEGGAMRGLFTCGVIDVLMENGIDFSGAIGVSAGACFGCNIKSRQIGRAYRYNKQYCNDSRYSSIKSWITTGDLYNAEFCYETLPFELDLWDLEAWRDNPMDFYVVATDVETGKPVYKKLGDEVEDIMWIRASASMPVAARPVEIDGGAYLDGGITDPLPVWFMEEQGYDRIVVVETQAGDYRKKPQKGMKVLEALLKKYPKVADAFRVRYLMYNAEKKYIARKEAAGELFVFRPEQPLEIGKIEKDPAEIERVYMEGRKVAEKNLEACRAFLEK